MSGHRSGGGPARVITKVNTAGQIGIGSASVTGVGSNFSAWGQVSAGLSGDTLFTQVTVELSASTFSTVNFTTVDVAVGGAGSESRITTVPVVPIYLGSTARIAFGSLPIPIRVAAGQRVAARIYDPGNNFAGATVTLTLYGFLYANLENS